MSCYLTSLGSALTRRFASGHSAVAGEHAGGTKRWKILSFLVALPGVAVCYANAFIFQDSHIHPTAFVPYAHLRQRTKPFPWGDGNHTLFHNTEMNPLPDGYEE